MKQLTDNQIKKSFVNASRREVERITIPTHLAEVDWTDHEYIGWTDPKMPQRAYVIVPVDEVPRGLVFRATAAAKTQAMCNWCEDLHDLHGVRMFVAKKAGASGRNGNSLGTLIHGDFNCPERVRVAPRAIEGQNDPEAFIARRVATLSDHSANFVRRIMGEK